MNSYKLFFMYASLIYLGGATIYTRYKMTFPQFDIGGVFAFSLVFILAIKFLKKQKKYKGLLLLGLFILLWTIFQYVKYGENVIYFQLIWDVLAGFVICIAYKEEVFLYYEHCLTKLCLLSIILWFASWMIPFFPPLLIAISPNWIHALEESNILIFGLQPSSFDGALFFRRNCGFAWEPGRFSCFIVMGIFYNLARTKFSLTNKNFKILLIALLTTQSTTGFATLGIIFLFYIYNVKKKHIIPAICFIGVLFIAIGSLPFMSEKISTSWISKSHNQEFEKKVTYWTEEEKETVVPQRFDGLLWEFYNIKHDPILGYGKDPSRSYTGDYFDNRLVLYNGNLKVFAILGLIWGGLYFIVLFGGSRYFSLFFNIKGKYFAALLFISINVSYPFQFEPLFLAMFFMPLYLNYQIQRISHEKDNHNIPIH